MYHKQSSARELSCVNSRPARRPQSGCKTVTLSVRDLDRLLDWCANSYAHTDDGTVVDIETIDWFCEAYDQASFALAAAL